MFSSFNRTDVVFVGSFLLRGASAGASFAPLTPLIRRLRRHLPPRWGRLYIEEIAHAISTLVVAFFNKVEHVGTLWVGVDFFHVFWA